MCHLAVPMTCTAAAREIQYSKVENKDAQYLAQVRIQLFKGTVSAWYG